MSGIKLAHIAYRYHKQGLFDDVTLAIKEHHITCFVGPNGSGKSTFLKLIAGLIKQQHGLITLDNQDIHTYSRKALAKKLAYLPQQCCLPTSLTVSEYVALARFSHQSWFSKFTDEDYTAIEQAIRMTDLQAHIDKPVTTLSSGQQQRARIALLLAQESDYLLLDEPMNGLDLKQQRNMLKLFNKLRCDFGKTIIMIHHDLHQVIEIADEVILLKDGSVYAQGHPQKVLNADLIFKVFDYECEVSPTTSNMFYIVPKRNAIGSNSNL